MVPPSWRLECQLEAGVTVEIRTGPSNERTPVDMLGRRMNATVLLIKVLG
jgi:hypothetical protein